MSNTKKQKTDKRSFSLADTFIRWRKDKHPAILFIAKFIGVYGVFYLIISLDYFRSNIHPVISNINAVIASFGLNILGENTIVSTNDIIQSSYFSVNIQQGCDAIEPMGLFIASIVAFPAIVRNKLLGVVLGVGVLFVANIIRIESLFLIGSKSPHLFEIMHKDIWPFIFIVLTISLTFLWIRKANEKAQIE